MRMFMRASDANIQPSQQEIGFRDLHDAAKSTKTAVPRTEKPEDLVGPEGVARRDDNTADGTASFQKVNLEKRAQPLDI